MLAATHWPTPPYSVSPNQSALFNHGLDRSAVCVAVGLFGLPRTFTSRHVVDAWEKNLVQPLKPCVDLYFAFGFGEQHGGMGTDCKSCIVTKGQQAWSNLLYSIQVLHPIAALGTWTSVGRRRKQEMVVHAIISVQKAVAVREYDWTLLTRPDMILMRPFKGQQFLHDLMLQAHFSNSTTRFRLMDFVFLVPNSKPFQKPPLPIMIRGTSIDREPWDAMALRGGRVCREDADWAQQRTALDQMWTTVSGRDVYLRKVPRYGPERVYQIASIFCLRYGVQLRRNAWIGFRNLTLSGAPTHASCSSSNLADHLFIALLNRTLHPNSSELQWRETLKQLIDTGLTVSFLSSRSTAAIRHLACSCAEWEQVQSLPSHRLVESADDVVDVYNHEALECNDSLQEREVLPARRHLQELTVRRLDNVLKLIWVATKQHDDGVGRKVPQASHADALEQSQLCRLACSLYGEMAIFCDAYRYSLDLLPPGDAVSEPTYSDHGTPWHATLAEAVRAMKFVHSSPHIISQCITCGSALHHTWTVWKNATHAASTTPGARTFSKACHHFAMWDSFRLVDPHRGQTSAIDFCA